MPMTKNQLTEMSLQLQYFQMLAELALIAEGMVKRGEAPSVTVALVQVVASIGEQKETLIQMVAELKAASA